MKKSPLLRKTPIARGTSQLKRTPMKKKAPKKRAGHDKSMLAACRGQRCYLQVAGVCCGDPATVVPCHANSHKYGKGMGLKADDQYTVPGCWTCHKWLDTGMADRAEKDAAWESAYAHWMIDRQLLSE